MSKLPEIGKRYKQINNGKCVKVRGYSMTDYNPVLVYYCYLEDEERYGYNFDMFLKEFEELPDQEPTINHIVDANKKGVNEALEEFKTKLMTPMSTPIDEDPEKSWRDFYFLLKKASWNLIKALDTQRKTENLYTKEEHVKKTEKSLHEKSIWKPISEISEDYSHCYIRFVSGNIKLAQSIEGKFFGIDENIDNDHYQNVKEYCSLTDFINKQEKLEKEEPVDDCPACKTNIFWEADIGNCMRCATTHIKKELINRIAKEIKEKIRSGDLYGFAYISLLIDTVDEYFLGAKQSLKDDITMKILDILEDDGIKQPNF